MVSTLLNAKWSRTPFDLETAEFLANENNDFFWAFIDYMAENINMASKISEEYYYQKLITFASR